MALKSFLSLVDDKLAEAFHYVAPDKTKHRKPFIKGLDKVVEQFEEGKPRGGASAQWSANNNVVHFTPKLVNVPVTLEGKNEFFIPTERFRDAIVELRKEAEAGELDDALHEAYEGASKGSARETRRDSSTGSVRAGWSDERRAKFQASVAARKANKTK